ncbi:hypothetical protein B484DRAFT_457116 [Ochromonadaceae sp. CCMP2298]|nr:hypothetical protein B484DRAFT_457116 [Ochromonadaceae sp. CCMP2298]
METNLPAHRVILCREGDFFTTMFCSSFRESRDPICCIEPVYPAVTLADFKAFLYYLYSDELPTGTGAGAGAGTGITATAGEGAGDFEAASVMTLAHQFGCPRLTALCEECVAKSLAKQLQEVWYDHDDDEDKARERMHALIEGTSQSEGYSVRG